MTRQITITAEYFRQYRQKLGFSNQADVKNFFGAKDITPTVDLNYIALLNERLYNILDKVNAVVANDIKIDDLAIFLIVSIVGFCCFPASMLIIVLLETSARRASFSCDKPNFSLIFLILLDSTILK